MQPVSILSDVLEIDDTFLAAVRCVAGADDVLLLRTWNGVDPVTFELPAEEDREAPVYIERYRRPGRYGLDISIFGKHRTAPNLSEAAFIRALARTLGRPLVASDCDANPWSWFRFNPDGSIDRVYTVADAESGEALYDLACDVAADHPEFLAAKPVWPADEALPVKSDAEPDHLTRERQAFCSDRKPGLCETFWAPCPYRRGET